MKSYKLCPYCGEKNDVNDVACKNCYESIMAVMETIETEDVEDKYYKKCPTCGEKNYLEFRNERIGSCRLCHFNGIDRCLSMKDEAKKTEVKVDIETRVKRLALQSLTDYKIVNIPDREGIVGRYGTIESDYFANIDHISGNHLLFFYAKGKCTIEDLNSTNGTRLNGIRLKPQTKYEIKKGDKIQISTLDFEVIEI